MSTKWTFVRVACPSIDTAHLRKSGRLHFISDSLMVLCLFLLLAVLAGCGSTGSGTTSSSTALAEQTGKKPLVIYFTYSENIGNTSDMSVDAVTSASLHEPTENKEGNMQVMVKEIQEKTGADAFSILVQEPYDPT